MEATRRESGGKPMNNAQLIEEVCTASVFLREAMRAHLASFGTLVPHVFMGNVLARVGSCLALGGHHAMREHATELEGILGALEHGMASGDRETRNVVAISFASDSELELFFEDLRPMLGPRLRAQLQGK